MKKLILVFVLVMTIVACKEAEKNISIEGYQVIGTAPGVYNGIRAYLKVKDQRGREVAIDTAIVMNESFKFEGDLNTPQMVNLTVNSIDGNLPLMLETYRISVNINKNNLSDSEVTGSPTNDKLREFYDTAKSISDKNMKLRNQFKQMRSQPKRKQRLSEQIIEINERQKNYPFEFLSQNNDNYFSLILTGTLLKERKTDIERIAKTYEGFTQDLKKSELGKELNSKIQSVQLEMAALTATEIGKRAPNFSAPNPEGKTTALKDIMGKVTIVDFWAAWCGPCRRENPNVVRVYEKFHDKGLEIIGVSLDGNRRQKDPRAAWTKAIKDDNLSWHQVSNLKYFNEPIAKTYNVRSIPATFILDENGIIVAKNLRGNDLEKKVAELIN